MEAEELAGNIRVLVRLRPLLPKELASGEHQATLVDVNSSRDTISVTEPTTGEEETLATKRSFSFGSVLPTTATQDEVWRGGDLERVVRAVLCGVHATVFAYGQTGSGKTFTMDGPRPGAQSEEMHGITPRAIRRFFALVDEEERKLARQLEEPKAREVEEGQAEDDGEEEEEVRQVRSNVRQFTVKVSFMQIYDEKVYDLLAAAVPRSDRGPRSRTRDTAGLKIRWSAKREFYVENLYEYECTSAAEAEVHLLNGLKKRIVASHKMNQASSRSHSIFTLTLERKHVSTANGRPRRSGAGNVVSSRLTLVDLAGSERASEVGALNRKKLMKQSIGINKSLFVLRKVIKGLAEAQKAKKREERKQAADGAGARTKRKGRRKRKGKGKGKAVGPHIPFRDSTLTRLLKNSLGGNCVTLMIACICPSDKYYEENISTLSYASLASRIANRAVVNEDPNVVMIKKLRKEVTFLKTQLQRAQRLFAIKQTELLDGDADAGGTDAAPEAMPQLQALLNAVASGGGGGEGGEGGQENSELALKFVDAVEMVKSLLADNTALRQSIEELDADAEAIGLENDILNDENAALRDRVQLLKSVIIEADGDASDLIPPSPLPWSASPSMLADDLDAVSETGDDADARRPYSPLISPRVGSPSLSVPSRSLMRPSSPSSPRSDSPDSASQQAEAQRMQERLIVQAGELEATKEENQKLRQMLIETQRELELQKSSKEKNGKKKKKKKNTKGKGERTKKIKPSARSAASAKHGRAGRVSQRHKRVQSAAPKASAKQILDKTLATPPTPASGDALSAEQLQALISGPQAPKSRNSLVFINDRTSGAPSLPSLAPRPPTSGSEPDAAVDRLHELLVSRSRARSSRG